MHAEFARRAHRRQVAEQKSKAIVIVPGHTVTTVETVSATHAVPKGPLPMRPPPPAAPSPKITPSTPPTLPNPTIPPIVPSLVPTPSAIPTPTPTPTPTPAPVVAPSSPSSSNRPISSPSASKSTPPKSATAAGASQSSAQDASKLHGAAKKGIPGAAVGVIVALFLIVMLALAAFLMRKRLVSRREQRRNTWGAGKFPSYSEKQNEASTPLNQALAPPLQEKPTSPMTISSFGVGPHASPWDQPPRPISSQVPAQLPNPYHIAPPPMSYNNPMIDEMYGSISQPVSQPTRDLAASPGPIRANDTAVVRCVFIPTLPDELPINTGETVRVVNPFDDGWALCANMRGEQGMVPLECLEKRLMATQFGGYGQHEVSGGDWRNVKRASSLHTSNFPGGF